MIRNVKIALEAKNIASRAHYINFQGGNVMKNKIYILIIIVLLIIIAIMGVQLVNINKEEPIAEEKSNDSNNVPERFVSIRFNEDISVDGTIEEIEDLRFNHIRIDEDDFSIRADFMLENMSENDIEAQKLKVSFYNKEGKEILSKQIETQKIEANGYQSIKIEFEKENKSDFELIYDVKISK